MDARYSAFRPETDRIFDTVSEKLRANTVQVLEEAAARSLTPHSAARTLAQERVLKAMRLHGKSMAN
jgi:glutamate dehydrogenase (NAD(P)+)